MTALAPFQRFLLGVLSGAGQRARLMILMFHQVTQASDPLAVTVPDAALFARQMGWLAEWCNVLPLTEAAARLAAGTLPPRAVAITFDDGYENNLTIAAPILRALKLPATFFVTGGAVERGIMWNDLVIEGVRICRGQLDLDSLNLGRFTLSNDAGRCDAIPRILGSLKYRPINERWNTALEIFRRAGGGDWPRLMMTREQVSELAGEQFDIGAHTISHPILRELSDIDAQREIEESRAWVADTTGFPPVAFAYPNGRPDLDYDSRHIRMLSASGFEVAVSTAWGCAVQESPLLELPRFGPWESSRGAFWSRLMKTALTSYVRPAASAST